MQTQNVKKTGWLRCLIICIVLYIVLTSLMTLSGCDNSETSATTETHPLLAPLFKAPEEGEILIFQESPEIEGVYIEPEEITGKNFDLEHVFNKYVYQKYGAFTVKVRVINLSKWKVLVIDDGAYAGVINYSLVLRWKDKSGNYFRPLSLIGDDSVLEFKVKFPQVVSYEIGYQYQDVEFPRVPASMMKDIGSYELLLVKNSWFEQSGGRFKDPQTETVILGGEPAFFIYMGHDPKFIDGTYKEKLSGGKKLFLVYEADLDSSLVWSDPKTFVSDLNKRVHLIIYFWDLRENPSSIKGIVNWFDSSGAIIGTEERIFDPVILKNQPKLYWRELPYRWELPFPAGYEVPLGKLVEENESKVKSYEFWLEEIK